MSSFPLTTDSDNVKSRILRDQCGCRYAVTCYIDIFINTGRS